MLACRCMAHNLNLAAKHVLEAFASTPRNSTRKRISRTAEPATDDEDDVDQDEPEDEEDGGLDSDKLVNFNPHDLLGKVHAFVTQACPHFDGSCHVVSDRQ